MNEGGIQSLKKAIEICGGRRVLAEILGISAAAVGQWLFEPTSKNFRSVPPKRCVRIEKLTSGLVNRRDLRPDDWRDIWPELANSDESPVAAPAQQAQAAIKPVAQGEA